MIEKKPVVAEKPGKMAKKVSSSDNSSEDDATPPKVKKLSGLTNHAISI